MKHYLWHRFIMSFLRITVGPFVKRIFRYSCKRQKGPERPAIVISNHNSDLDPAFVGLGFSRHMYFLTSEHALRNGFPSKMLDFIFSPVSIDKTNTDIQAVKEMIRRIKKGASLCLFAEGDRSFSGKTAPLTISAAKLVKASRADLITFRIEGGYFTTPRWGKKMRKGAMTGGVVNTYTAQEIKSKTDREVLALIESDIFVDAYGTQSKEHILYKGKDLAENIETALYLCPGCGKPGTIISRGNDFSCECGLKAEYTESGFLEGEGLPFSTITEWYEWQESELVKIVKNAGDSLICADEGQRLYEVEVTVGKKIIGEGQLRIDREALHCAGMRFPIERITRMAVAGQMILLFSLKDGPTYEVRSTVPRSALKYREIFRILSGIIPR